MPILPHKPPEEKRQRLSAVSYCLECDALPGECGHTGRRYLSAVVYDHVGKSAEGLDMWALPEHERWRVDHPPSTWASLDVERIDYGASRPEEFPPVETENGEYYRQQGLRVLGERYRVLAKRAKRRSLFPRERKELDELERVIGQLEAMAPIAPLQPGKEGGTLAYPLDYD